MIRTRIGRLRKCRYRSDHNHSCKGRNLSCRFQQQHCNHRYLPLRMHSRNCKHTYHLDR